MAVFGVAFERWVGETNRRSLPELIRATLDELNALTADERGSPVGSSAL